MTEREFLSQLLEEDIEREMLKADSLKEEVSEYNSTTTKEPWEEYNEKTL